MSADILRNEWEKLLYGLKSVYIFGTKEVALKLYDLICEEEVIDYFEGFIVSSANKDEETVKGKKVWSISEIEDKDINILMSVSEVYHPEAFELLKKLGFINVIPAHKFFMLEEKTMDMSMEIESIIDSNVDLSNDDRALQEKVVQAIKRNKFAFDEALPYQSFERLGIKGIRNTIYRIEKYNLDKYLGSESVLLDIGCNYGFFDLSIQGRVKEIIAVEYSNELVEIGKLVRDELGIRNVNFISGDYNEFQKNVKEESFDVIFSFAVHVWLGVSPSEYAEQLYKMLKGKGYLFFESQTYSSDKKFIEYIDAMKNVGFNVCEDIIHCDDGATERRIIILQKG